jgi:hypothetical protein
MRGLVHIFLTVVVAITPALCCCQARLFSGHAVALSKSNDAAENTSQVPASCCHPEHTAKIEKHSSCCQENLTSTSDTKPVPLSTPGQCCCSMERIDTALPKAAPQLSPLEWTGELVPLALLGVVGISPEHLGLVGGLQPPERAGVDTRSAALFDRHVMRC